MLVFVTMRYADRPTAAAFEEQVAGIPHVLQAQRLFGDPDYLLRVVARDLPAYRQLDDERLAALPGILLGAYDLRILAWLAGWEPQVRAVVAGLITRAGSHGEAVRP